MIASDEFKRGMRHLPSGVALITTGLPGHRRGLTATAAMSLTAEPPQLVVAVNHSASAYPSIVGNRAFAVNVIPICDHALADIFAGQTDLKGEARFAHGAWIQLETGSPILCSAVVSFDCRVMREIDVATHSLFIGAVEAMRLEPGQTPLVHLNGAWGVAAKGPFA